MRRNPQATEVVYVDQADQEFAQLREKNTNYSHSRGPSDILNESLPIVLTNKKNSRAMSSPKVFARRWKEVDREMRKGYMH